jgi:hypothetical protein
MNIGPVEAELFYADGQTDRYDEANSHFSQICESAQKRTWKATARYESGKGRLYFVCIPQTNEITTCSTDLFKLPVTQLVETFWSFQGTPRFIAVFTTDRPFSLSRAR